MDTVLIPRVISFHFALSNGNLPQQSVTIVYLNYGVKLSVFAVALMTLYSAE